MTRRTRRSGPRIVLGLGSVLAAVFLLVWVVQVRQVRGQSADEARITEVRPTADGVGASILINLGAASGIRPGQTVEIRRGEHLVGYGSVEKVFSRLAVAAIGTVVAGLEPLRVGDRVVFLDSGFHREAAPAPAEPSPPEPGGAPRGEVVSVREGVVLVDFGSDAGLEVGHLVAVLDASGAEIGRVAIELISPKTGGGLLTRGRVQVGCQAAVVGRVTREVDGAPLDFVALDFLGVVADLEHPTPHRAPCHVGVPVRRIMPGSPAQRAGLGHGDRVVAIDGIVVRDAAGIRKRIQARRSDRVRVLAIRGDRVISVDVEFTPGH